MKPSQIRAEFPMKTCVICSGNQFVDVKVPDDMVVDGVTYTDHIPAQECTQCGEAYMIGGYIADREDRLIEQLLKIEDPSDVVKAYVEKYHRGRMKLAAIMREYEQDQDGLGKQLH